MKRKTILTLGAAATAAVIGAIGIPAIASGWGPDGSWGPQQMMRMMHAGQGGFAQVHRGPWTMMPRGGHGPMGMTDNPVYRSFDSDADGTVTAAELETGIAALHARYDSDGDGTLTEEEFAALFAEITRGFAARPFAMLDADDDGRISAEEMAFPAQMMTRMERMHGAAPETAPQQQ